MLTERVDAAARRQAALDLLTRYIRIVDDARRIAEWPDLFASETEYIVVTRENHERGLPVAIVRDDSRDRIADRVTVIREFWGAGGRAEDRHYNEPWPRHVVGPVWADLTESGDVTVGAHFVVYQTVQISETPRLLAMGEYQDVVTFADGTPRFRSKRVILDTPILQDVFVYPL